MTKQPSVAETTTPPGTVVAQYIDHRDWYVGVIVERPTTHSMNPFPKKAIRDEYHPVLILGIFYDRDNRSIFSMPEMPFPAYRWGEKKLAIPYDLTPYVDRLAERMPEAKDIGSSKMFLLTTRQREIIALAFVADAFRDFGMNCKRPIWFDPDLPEKDFDRFKRELSLAGVPTRKMAA